MKPSKRAAGMLLTLLPAAILCSCTCLTVTKLPPEGNTNSLAGVKYSLPKPYIQVTPQEDGSVIAEVVYLPDPDRTYVVHGSSWLATHNLGIATEDGLLKKVSWTGDSAAVVSQGITSAASAAEKQLAAQAIAAKADDTKIETAKKAVADAELAVELARSNLELLVVNNADADLILKAKVALNEAQIKLTHAVANLNRLLGKAKFEDTFDVRPKGFVGPLQPHVIGPILYSIKERLTPEGKPTVALVAARQNTGTECSAQPRYPVNTPYKPPTPEKPLEFFPKGIEGVRPDKGGNMQLIVIASSPLYDIVHNESQLKSSGNVTNLPPISLQTPTTVRVALSGTLVGDYALTLAYKTKKDDASKSHEVRFRVVP